ncbi:MAG: hypothetical protein IT372_39685 [Polyangiaceae bacterium]|nr:hypothetical protein [Polyangiaceae bacterium]
MLVLFTGSLAAAGCSAPVVDAADANGTMTQGLVLVERSAAEGAAPQTNVSAKFMRLSAAADPDLAERVVGSTFELPASGECAPLAGVGGEDAAPGLSALGSIELLDVGDVTVRTGEAAPMPLATRAFPDVGDLVFGVFYTSRDAASELPAPARYVFESTGSGLLDRFSFEADAPGGPEEIRLGDVELGEGAELTEGASATIDWKAEAPGDVVVVDLGAQSGSAVRCAFRDTGHGVIPGAVLRSEALGPLPASLTVTVRRVREVAFAASGVDLGEVRFDLAVLGRATLARR